MSRENRSRPQDAGIATGGVKFIVSAIHFSVCGSERQDGWESSCERPSMLCLKVFYLTPGTVEALRILSREQEGQVWIFRSLCSG